MNRLLNRLYARVMGYFWMPCPLCGEYFGGHEWHPGASIHVIGDPVELNTGICVRCYMDGFSGTSWPPEALHLTR